MLKKVSIAVGVLVFLVAVFIFDTVNDAGAFKEIEPHFSGTCSVVEGVVGAEDITIDQSIGLLISQRMTGALGARTGNWVVLFICIELAV